MIEPISFDFMSLPSQTSPARIPELMPFGVGSGLGMDPEVSLFASLMTQCIKPSGEDDDD